MAPDRWQKYFLPLMVFIFLAVFVVYPTIKVFESSLTVQGHYSFENYLKLFTQPNLLKILWQSISVALLVAVVSTVIGLAVSLTVFKTNLPFKKFFVISATVPLIIPGFIASIAYIFLFGRNGLITYKLLGLDLDIYNWASVAVIHCFDFTAVSFFLISAVLVNIDSQTEDAARNLGADDWKVFTTVTLPLLLPGVIAAMILTFLRSMSSFGSVIFLGGQFNTLASASYIQLIGRYNMEMASTLNAALLLISMMAFFLFLKFQSGSQNIRVMPGAETKKNIDFPKSVKAALLICSITFSIFTTLILLSVFTASFTRHIGTNYQLTLEHFIHALQRGSQGIINTFYFASITAIVVSISGILTAYLITRVNFKGKNILDMLATIPFAIPGTFIGIGYILAFNNAPLVLTGTWVIVIVATVVRNIPLGLRAGVSVMYRQDRSIEDASLNLGSSQTGSFCRIVFPMSSSAVLITALYAFVATIQTLGAIIFLITPGTKLIAIDVFEAIHLGNIGLAAALSVIMVLMSASGMSAIFLIHNKEDITKWVQIKTTKIQKKLSFNS